MIDEKTYGSQHPRVAEDLNHIAELLREQVRFARRSQGNLDRNVDQGSGGCDGEAL